MVRNMSRKLVFLILVLIFPAISYAQEPTCNQVETSRKPSKEKREAKKDYKTVAQIKIKGGHDGMPGINEVVMGCTPAAFARGLWYLIALNDPKNTSEDVDIESIHKGLQTQLSFFPVKPKRGTKPSGGGGGKYYPGTPGPSNKYPWAKLKDQYAAKLGYKIKTRAGRKPTADHKFFKQLIGFINAGYAVEIWTGGHTTFISEVVQYDDGNYGFVMADDKTPDGKKASTDRRGPYKFDEDGNCITMPTLKILTYYVEQYQGKI